VQVFLGQRRKTDLMTLHPFIAALVEAARGKPAPVDTPPVEYRRLAAARRSAFGTGPEMAQAEDIPIPTRGSDLMARLLVPYGGAKGVLVYLHGGGWVIGHPDEFDTLGRALAQASGMAVVIPDYRLAPEHPFPAGLEDCEDALRWVQHRVDALEGIDGPMVVAGDSAGGNLATVALRRSDEVQAVLQVLIYPVTDCDMGRGSYERNGSGLPLSKRDMKAFFSHYAPGRDLTDPDISPLRASDLSGLPPALILTAEHDVLADEGAAYARALRQAGVPVTHHLVSGVTHGFIRWHNAFPVAQEAVELIASAARDAAR
jgi:acetyl esterase